MLPQRQLRSETFQSMHPKFAHSSSCCTVSTTIHPCSCSVTFKLTNCRGCHLSKRAARSFVNMSASWSFPGRRDILTGHCAKSAKFTSPDFRACPHERPCPLTGATFKDWRSAHPSSTTGCILLMSTTRAILNNFLAHVDHCTASASADDVAAIEKHGRVPRDLARNEHHLLLHAGDHQKRHYFQKDEVPSNRHPCVFGSLGVVECSLCVTCQAQASLLSPTIPAVYAGSCVLRLTSKCQNVLHDSTPQRAPNKGALPIKTTCHLRALDVFHIGAECFVVFARERDWLRVFLHQEASECGTLPRVRQATPPSKTK